MEFISAIEIWIVFFTRLLPVWISLFITFSALFFWRKHLGILGHLCNSTIGLVGLFIVLFWVFGAIFADMTLKKFQMTNSIHGTQHKTQSETQQ